MASRVLLKILAVPNKQALSSRAMILGVPKFYDVHSLSQNDSGLRALSVVVLIVVLILESKLSITYVLAHCMR